MAFPEDPLDIHIEFYVDGGWVDFTNLRPTYNCYVLGMDGTNAVQIKNIARNNEGGMGRVNSITVNMEFMDPDAILSHRNAYSPYYRKLGKFTPARLVVDSAVRASGEISMISPNWDEASETYTTVNVEFTGLLNRIGSNKAVIKSALTAYIEQENPFMWYSMEVGDGTTIREIPSNVAGMPALLAAPASTGGVDDHRFSGVIGGNAQGPYGAIRALDMSKGGQLSSVIPRPNVQFASLTASWMFEMGFKFDDPIDYATGATGQIVRFGFGNQAGLIGIFAGESPTETIVEIADNIGFDSVTNTLVIDDGQWHWLRLLVEDDGAGDIDYTVVIDDQFITNARNVAIEMGQPHNIFISPGGDVSAVSHAVLWRGSDIPATVSGAYTAFTGHSGELSGDRFERLMTQEGYPYTVIGNTDYTMPMGPQKTDMEANLIDIAYTDGGILYEYESALELRYRTRRSMYNQVSKFTLVYSNPTAHLSLPFQPADDDSNFSNDVTAKLGNDLKGRYFIPDGDWVHWSTEPPPLGANTKTFEPETNLPDESYLDEQAAWIAHLNSWREPRFDSVSVKLSRAAFVGDTDLVEAIRALEVGDWFTIDCAGAPKWLPQDEIRLMDLGWVNSIGAFQDDFQFMTEQADRYEADIVDTSGTMLAVAVDDNDTSLKLATTLGSEWSSEDEPYYIEIGGEVMKVTAMVGDTPAYVAAGAIDADTNASLTPGIPAGMAAGGLMICWASIRNSGTGVVGTNPAGWETLVDFANTRLMYRYWVTGDSAPTVTFTGGVANATTIAQIFGFSGLSHGLASGTKATPAGITQLNSSAQNIAYPYSKLQRPGAVLLFAWKQDDWTSVAPPSGYTEIQDASSTLGDDAGHWAGYDLSGATDVGGSLVVTGGGAAISRAIMIALRPTQTATVERGINNVAIAHTYGDAVHGWRMGVTGL